MAGQKRRLESGDGGAAIPSAAVRSGGAAAASAGEAGAAKASSSGRRSGSSAGPGSGSGRSSSGAAAAAEPAADFGRSSLPPHALRHWAAAGSAPLQLSAVAPGAELASLSSSGGGAPGQAFVLQRLWAAAPSAVATLLAAPAAPVRNADPWALSDRRSPEAVAAQCAAIVAVQVQRVPLLRTRAHARHPMLVLLRLTAQVLLKM